MWSSPPRMRRKFLVDDFGNNQVLDAEVIPLSHSLLFGSTTRAYLAQTRINERNYMVPILSGTPDFMENVEIQSQGMRIS